MNHLGADLERRRGLNWRRGPGWRGLNWRREFAVPVLVLALQVAGTFGAQRHHSVAQLGLLGWLLLAAGPLALTVRRAHPVAVLWTALAVTLPPFTSPAANLSLVVAFFGAAVSGHRRAAWAAIVAGYAAAVWLGPLAFGRPVGSLTFALLLGAWLAVLVVAAEAVRLRRERLAQARATRVADAQRQASEERLRMARDLHDVIGHNISLISVQAAVGLDLMDSDPEQARAALTAIRSVSREALDELRSMLAALRQADEQPPTAPTPGLARLPELCELTRAAGIPVRTEVAGPVRPLPAAVDLAAYRIVQESLTNVARHAGPATATVRLGYQAGGVSVEVLDDGRGTPGARSAGGTGARGMGAGGAGSGIAGMTERAAALGGGLTAGPRPGGGFAVTAWLPVPAGAEPAGPGPAGQEETAAAPGGTP
jgi:signal transduction histidine kinase